MSLRLKLVPATSQPDGADEFTVASDGIRHELELLETDSGNREVYLQRLDRRIAGFDNFAFLGF